MSKLITITEASNRIGVDRQTLINWGNSGVIKIKKMSQKNNASWYVSEECINEIADACFDVVEVKKLLAQELQETKIAEKEANLILKDIRRQIRLTRRFANMVVATDFDVRFIDAMYTIGKINKREAFVMKHVVRGDDMSSVAEDLLLSRARVSQIFFKGCKKCGNIEDIKDRLDEAEKLKEQNVELLADLKMMEEENQMLRIKLGMKEEEERLKTEEEARNWINENDEMCKLLSRRLIDCELSVRALNCLKEANLDTIGDVAKWNKVDFLKLRNFGKKTLIELDDLFEDLGLNFGMDVDAYYRKRIDARLGLLKNDSDISNS